jgi:hypothetical protein
MIEKLELFGFEYPLFRAMLLLCCVGTAEICQLRETNDFSLAHEMTESPD